MKRALLVGVGFLATIVAVLFFFILWPAWSRPELHGTEFQDPGPAPNINLRDTAGRPVSLRDFEGKVVLLYFGYTYCPDACPATMADLARVQREVDDEAANVQVLMVTVDPERDTPEALADYLGHFHPSFIGLTGDEAAIEAAAAAFGVFHHKHEGTAATGYLVDHTTRVFLVDRQGRYRLTYPFGATVSDMAADLRVLMRER